MILEVWFCILDFGVWIWRFGQKKHMRKKQKEEKLHCLQGANPVLLQREWPPRGNSCDFLLTFWDVMGNPMNGTEKNKKKLEKNTENCKKPIRKTIPDLWVTSWPKVWNHSFKSRDPLGEIDLGFKIKALYWSTTVPPEYLSYIFLVCVGQVTKCKVGCTLASSEACWIPRILDLCGNLLR